MATITSDTLEDSRCVMHERGWRLDICTREDEITVFRCSDDALDALVAAILDRKKAAKVMEASHAT